MASKVKKQRNSRILQVVMALVMIFCMMMATTSMAYAEDSSSANDAVTEVGNSLVQVRMVYTDSNGTKTAIQGGTGFLINVNTVLTCAHVVDVDSETTDLLKDLFGSNYNKNNLSLEIVVTGDVTITATVKKESQASDFAILNLTEPIYSRVPASLGVGADVESTQLVYALGFPASVAELQDKNTYTSKDVTITDGKVSKLNTSEGVDFIQHGAVLTEGNSGGPLVDASGNVIGINKGVIEDGGYSYAINIDQVKEVLDALGIEYTSGTQTAVVSSETVSSEEETDTTEVESVVEEESDILPPVDDNSDSDPIVVEPEKNNTKTIIIVAIAALFIILIVVVVLIVLSGKKDTSAKIQPANTTPITNGAQQPQQMNNGPQQPHFPQQNSQFAPQQQMYNRATVAMGASPTAISTEGAGETSVLNDGAGETTVLGNQSTGFFLVRKSNGDKININKPEFVIGKERRRVDYCISDNNSISRTHAKLRIRADRCYISDLGSTNCTFVNGTKISPNQEVVLSKGDEIRVSDEAFEFLG